MENMADRKVTQPDVVQLLLTDLSKPEDLIREKGILIQLSNAILERVSPHHLSKGVFPAKSGRSRRPGRW